MPKLPTLPQHSLALWEQQREHLEGPEPGLGPAALLALLALLAQVLPLVGLSAVESGRCPQGLGPQQVDIQARPLLETFQGRLPVPRRLLRPGPCPVPLHPGVSNP